MHTYTFSHTNIHTDTHTHTEAHTHRHTHTRRHTHTHTHPLTQLAIGVLGAVTTVLFVIAERVPQPRPSDCEPLLISDSSPNVQLS